MTEQYPFYSPMPEGERMHSVRLRTFVPVDLPSVLFLHEHGLLLDQVDPQDDISDLHQIDDAYLRRAQDHFWVAEADREIVGTIAVKEHEPQVAHIRRLRVAKHWQAAGVGSSLVHRALEHTREHEYLKVVLHTHVDVNHAIALFGDLGFIYAGYKDARGRRLLEFYTDLYHHPVPHHPSLPGH